MAKYGHQRWPTADRGLSRRPGSNGISLSVTGPVGWTSGACDRALGWGVLLRVWGVLTAERLRTFQSTRGGKGRWAVPRIRGLACETARATAPPVAFVQ